MNKTELHTRINEAVSAFWETKQKQLSSSGDNSNRGAVTAGKQLDGFIALLKDIAIQQPPLSAQKGPGITQRCLTTHP